jgi:hypothetical protein
MHIFCFLTSKLLPNFIAIIIITFEFIIRGHVLRYVKHNSNNYGFTKSKYIHVPLKIW